MPNNPFREAIRERKSNPFRAALKKRRANVDRTNATGALSTGVNEALITGAGAPVDALTWLYNFLPTQDIETPVGGSEWIRNISEEIGYEQTKPDTALERSLYNVGYGVGSGATFATGAGAVGALPKAASRVGQVVQTAAKQLAPASRGALAAELGASGGGAAGSYVGSTIGRDIAGPVGAIPGAIVGGLAAPTAVGTSMRPLGMLSPYTRSGQRRIAGEVLRESATDPTVPNLQRAPIRDVDLTTGQATKDPGLLSLEKGEAFSPEGRGAFQDRAELSNLRVRETLEGLGDGDTRQASIQMREQLEQAFDAAKAEEKRLWQAIDPEGEVTISTQPLKDNVDQYIEGLTKARRRRLPDDLVNQIKKDLDDEEPIVELTDLRSDINEAARTARRAGEYNKANVIQGLDDAVMARLDTVELSDPGARARYDRARQYTSELHTTFDREPIKRLLGTDAGGGAKVSAADTGTRVLRSDESLEAFRKAVGRGEGSTESVRNFFVSRLMEKAQSRVPGEGGTRTINVGALRNFVDKNRNLANRILTPAQRDLLDRVVKTAEMSERTSRFRSKGGSDTAAKLGGQKFVESLIFKGLGRGPVGKALRGPVDAFIMQAPNEDIRQLIQDALLDPSLARSLMAQKPNKPLSAKIRPYLVPAIATEYDREPR